MIVIIGFIIFFALIVLASLIITTRISNDCWFPQNYTAAKKLRKIVETYLDKEWKIRSCGWLTTTKEESDWWRIYVEVYNKNAPWNWTNNFFQFNYKLNKVSGAFNRNIIDEKEILRLPRHIRAEEKK